MKNKPSIRNKVIPKKAYSRINRSVNPSNSLEHIEPPTCEYYSLFKLPPIFSQDLISPHLSSDFIEKIAVLLTMSLSHHTTEWRKNMGLPSGNPTVCLIISNNGEILSWAINTSEADLIRHAEVNALNVYYQNNPGKDSLPIGSNIFISLKSCHMCAGAIRDSLKSTEDIRVIYCQNDPGQTKTVIENLRPAIEKQASHQKGDQDLLKILDDRYKLLKKDLNAALSLSHASLQEVSQIFVNEFRDLLTNLETSSQEEQKYLEYIKNFLEINKFEFQLSSS